MSKEQKDKSQRIMWIDTCKGLCTIFVIFLHSLGWAHKIYPSNIFSTGINLIINSFFMPMFYIVSGYCLNINNDPINFISKKIKRIMVPYCFFIICYVVFKLIFENYYLKNLHGYISILRNNIFNSVCITKDSSFSQWWFLPALFIAQIACYFICKYIRSYLIQVLVVVFCCLVSGVMHNYSYEYPFVLNESIVGLLYVYLGFIVKFFLKNKNENLIVTWKIVIISGVIYFVALCDWLLMNRSMISYFDSNVYPLGLSAIIALSACIICIFLSQRIQNIRLFREFGMCSLEIYGIHYIFLEMFYYLVFSKLHGRVFFIINYSLYFFLISSLSYIFARLLSYIKMRGRNVK